MNTALMTIDEREAYLDELANQPEFVTGYCYLTDGMYIGPYTFPNNKDKLEVHWPPMVAPVAPPPAPAGQAAFWTGAAWELREFIPNDGISAAFVATRDTAPEIIPMPQGQPVPDAYGQFPITVLNAEGTAYEWVYPPPPPPPYDPAPTP